MIASVIVALHLFGFVATGSAITSLYIAGVMLIIAELAVVSFGLIAFNGLLALYAGYALQSGQDLIFGVPVGWSTLFGIAFVEFFIIAAVIYIHFWIRGIKTSTGTEAMIGQKAVIVDWSGKKGTVRFEGEIWKAHAKSDMDLKAGDDVHIEAVNKLNLTITA
ncbi:MAG: hypothetical protein GC137_05125 [Alphaproteobacteria bacterium]|nr:hypothetical protein [Alphaproteobacteria bacterium]